MPSRPLLREGAGITVCDSSNASKTLNLRLGIGINSCFDSWLLCGLRPGRHRDPRSDLRPRRMAGLCRRHCAVAWPRSTLHPLAENYARPLTAKRTQKPVAENANSLIRSSEAEPDVTGVYRHVKSRKGAKQSLSHLHRKIRTTKPTKQIADKK